MASRPSIMEPQMWELFEGGSADDEVGVIIRMAPGHEPPAIAQVVARFDDIFTARLRRGDLVTVRESPFVISVKASTAVSQPLKEEYEEYEVGEGHEGDSEAEAPDEAAETAAPPYSEDGTGVVVGVCDWGFDFTHPNFRNADGSTRLLSLWDQRGFGDPLAPAPYNYGRLLTREAINAALKTDDPCGSLGYHPAIADATRTGAHGTHVCDILAGNRREPGSEVGLASGSEIVFVHLAAPHLGELGNLGDSVGLLEGLDFCRQQAKALGRPCVLHLSAGKTGGEKRGLSPLERAVDTMLKEPGVVLVQSVGNYASSAMHTHARVGPDQRHVLNWIVPPRDPTSNELEIWYSGEDVFEVTVIAPNGREFSVALNGRMRLEHDDMTWGNFYHRRHEPNSGLNHVAIYLYPAAPSGMWRIVLRGLDVVDGRMQAWIERDPRRRYQSHFLAAQASGQYTTNTICNCFRAIAVGAYDATQRSRPATRFSSRGPTADGRQKPEVAAPGYMIRAARSLPRDGWQGDESRLTVKSGTSMAAPWVSGTVALMMQAAGRPLNVYEIRRALIGSVDPHPGPTGRSSSKLGYGYLNTAAAVAAARRIGRGETPRAAAAAPFDAAAEAPSEEFGWAPVSVEDAAEDVVTQAPPPWDGGDGAHGSRERRTGANEEERRPTCFRCSPLPPVLRSEDPFPPSPPSPSSPCGCRRAERPAAREDPEDDADAVDETRAIDAPFEWEDVIGALDAFEDEDPA